MAANACKLVWDDAADALSAAAADANTAMAAVLGHSQRCVARPVAQASGAHTMPA